MRHKQVTTRKTQLESVADAVRRNAKPRFNKPTTEKERRILSVLMHPPIYDDDDYQRLNNQCLDNSIKKM